MYARIPNLPSVLTDKTRKMRSCFTNVQIAQHEKAMLWQYDKMDQLYNEFVRHGIIGVRGHQCRITKTVETPTACDTTTLRQDIHNRLAEISVQLKILHWNQSDTKEPKFLLTKIKYTEFG